MKRILQIFRILTFASAVLLLCINVSAQKGYPYVSPFSFDESIDNDNFDILQDNSYNILIANRKGILSFDSRNWELLPLQYYPVVLEKSKSDGSIYVGCQNGFGRLSQEITGKYTYELLSDTIFTGEISDICLTPDNRYFISGNKIYYSLSDEDNTSYWEFPEENQVKGSFVFMEEFYFMLSGLGLYKAEGDTFQLVNNDRFTRESGFIFACETDSKEILVGTEENELLVFKGSGFSPVNLKDSEYLKTSIITDGLYLGGNEIAIGSLMGGILVCDYKTGATTTILNLKTGLPDDEIYCMGADSNQGIWLCHVFGVSRIDNQLNVANLTWYPGLTGNLTNTAFFERKLYIGTSDGLYALKEKREYSSGIENIKAPVKSVNTAKSQETTSKSTGSDKPKPVINLTKKEQRQKKRGDKSDSKASSSQQAGFFERIINTIEKPVRIFDRKDDEAYKNKKKKVYSLQSISHSYEKIQGIKGKCTEILTVKDHLFVSSYSGLYYLNNGQVTSILENTSVDFINPGFNDRILFAGNGKSVYLLMLKDGKWRLEHEFSHLNYPVYSASMTAMDELWLGSDNAAHKLRFDSRYNVISDTSFLINTKFSDKVILRNINEQLYFFMSSGIFKLGNNEIKPVKTFEKLSSLPGYYFSGNNEVWYRTSGHWDVIPDNAGEKNTLREYLNIFETVQDIYPGKDGDIYLIANNQEVFHITAQSDKIDTDGFSVFFSGLKGTNDQLFPLVQPKISYGKSSLRIDFSAPYYIAPGKTEFAYMIEGLNETWSPWSNVSTIEYPLLPPGKYIIRAKARNIFGKESEITNLDIIIKPPFWRTTVFYIFVILIIFVLFVLIVRFREQNLIKAKLILEQKVKERTIEIEMQKNEIAEQKKEITDSIYYARRIQTAILPSTSMLNSVLPDHFVLFLPKDIVSGDFYWSFVKGDKIVILAADCTGHGVPGAFMSMLGVSFLNEIVSGHKLDSAGAILNNLRDHVKSTLSRSGGSEHTRDGMDIALCIIDQKAKKLQYAGAYNPLFMIRDGELSEIKADKMPIGWYDLNASFNDNIISIKKGDCFYIFSDGYVDQFGGQFGKKYLSKPFKNLLLKISDNEMSRQKELLNEEFESWKGKLHQVDDVLVIGFRI